MRNRNYFLLLFTLMLIGGGRLILAQPQPPVFATNTPQAASADVVLTPAAPMDQYALRTWRPDTLVALLESRVKQLGPGTTELQKAVRLLQFELGWRYPQVALSEHEATLQALLAAPAGSVELRAALWPYIEQQLNDPSGRAWLTGYGGFQIEIVAANIDSQPPLDAVLHVVYPDPDLGQATVFEAYIPAWIDEAGTYHLLPADDLPAYPADSITGLAIIATGDFNGNGLDEVVIAIDRAELNREVRIFELRSGSLMNVVQPGMRLYMGDLIAGFDGGDTIITQVYRMESAAWGCLAQQQVTWQWSANFYRPASSGNFQLQGTSACRFHASEPFLEMAPARALTELRALSALSGDVNDPVAQRALMLGVMIRALDGDFGSALAQALEIQPTAPEGSWLAEQLTAFITALAQPEVTPLQVCAAVMAASTDGACDVDMALARILSDNPLRRDTPVVDQLAQLGITVRDQWRVAQVGHAERQVVHFTLGGDHWWAFAPLDPDFYRAEQYMVEAETTSAPLAVLMVTQQMLDALLVDAEPARVLTLIENARLAQPQAAVSPGIRYLEAFSLDLLGDRSRARQAYYMLWQQEPYSPWGQLAAEHLEQR